MDAQLAAGIDQAVDHQQLQHLGPRHLAAVSDQLHVPERRQFQLVPEPAAQPAVAEAARPAQLHLVELDGDRVECFRRQRAVVGKQTQFTILLAVFVEDLQRPAPGLLLAVVDLAEIEHLALGGASAAGAAVLDNAEIAMRFSILPTFVICAST